MQQDNQLDNDRNESIILSDSIEEKLQNISDFAIPTVSLSFVESQLKSLDTSKSTGSDGLSARFLKMPASVIAPVLTKIYNDSLKTSSYPKKFNNAKVVHVAIHKKGKKTDKANYRHISILPIISLIFERHVSIHLSIF